MSNRVVTDHVSAILVVRSIAPWQPFPFATAAAFSGGWLRTGDLARIDDEGLVYLVDRMKDMINRASGNVLRRGRECPRRGTGVYDAAVLGVPDEMMARRWAP
jgi:long-chain acyl-CoA synthetase